MIHDQTDQHLIVLPEVFLCSGIRLLHHHPNVNVGLQYVHHLQKHIQQSHSKGFNHLTFSCILQNVIMCSKDI